MTTPETEARLRLYRPHPGQMELHTCEARFRAAACGRRWGKTMGAINELAKYSWENTEYPSWWVAPTYRQSRKPFHIILNKFKPAIASHKVADELSITWKSGGRSEFVSSDKAHNLRGEGVGFMVIDEAGFVSKMAWEEVLRPMLSDTMGRLLAIGTPKGKGGSWFYEMWLRGHDPLERDYAAFHFPTSSSPYISAEEIEEVKRVLPEAVYAQEYMASFLDDAAGVFRGVRKCLKGGFEGPRLGGRYVMGVDLAKRHDFTVCCVIDADRMHVVAFERYNQVSYELQLDRIATLAARYHAGVLMDWTGIGDPILDALQARGVRVEGFLFTARSKQQLIENLAVTIEHESVTFPEIPELLGELDCYGYEITKSRTMRYSAPEGKNDDCVIGLALAVWQAQHGFGGPVLLVWDENEVISPI